MGRRLWMVPIALAAVFAGGAVRVVQDQCGPFTDVTPAFCPFILELYDLGITAGTSATTFSPDDPLTRGQGSVFIAKGLNQSLARSSRRAALGQWWTTTPHWDLGLGVTAVGHSPQGVASDGQDIWVANIGGSISRVRASDGRYLETWTGAANANTVLVALGRVFAAGYGQPSGSLYAIDPRQPAGAVEIVTTDLSSFPNGLAFDGTRIWVAGYNNGLVSIVTPGATLPWPVTTVSGFSNPTGAVFDGSNVWMTDISAGTLLKLDANGGVLQSVPLGNAPYYPVFDGANIWVTQLVGDSVSVVQASTGIVIATLTGNGLLGPSQAAFDGERILVTDQGHFRGGDPTGVSVFRAADLTPLGFFATPGNSPVGACSDGTNFWISFGGDEGRIGRF